MQFRSYGGAIKGRKPRMQTVCNEQSEWNAGSRIVNIGAAVVSDRM